METKNDANIEEILIIWYYMVELVGGNISRAHDSIDNGTEDGQRMYKTTNQCGNPRLKSKQNSSDRKV